MSCLPRMTKQCQEKPSWPAISPVGKSEDDTDKEIYSFLICLEYLVVNFITGNNNQNSKQEISKECGSY